MNRKATKKTTWTPYKNMMIVREIEGKLVCIFPELRGSITDATKRQMGNLNGFAKDAMTIEDFMAQSEAVSKSKQREFLATFSAKVEGSYKLA